MPDVDPSEHLRLITHVIRQMGIEDREADEAYSEGLVAITEAAISYDPKYNVPVASWLARNIRWSIKTWQLKQLYNFSQPLPEIVESTDLDNLESRVAFNDLVRLMQKVLNQREQFILIASAMGYEGKEIAEKLGIGEMSVVRDKARARRKLKEFTELS